MSSADMSTFELEIPIGRSLMYSENSIGPKTDPCGTPRASTSASDSEPLMQQRCVRLLRYDLNLS